MKKTQRIIKLLMCVAVAVCCAAMISCGKEEAPKTDELFEKPITVTYMCETTQHSKIEYKSLKDANLPTEPQKSGYTFNGWWKIAEQDGKVYEQKFDLIDFLKSCNDKDNDKDNDQDIKDITVYAKFTQNELILSYDAGKGVEIPDAKGITFYEPYAPYKEGWSFAGWYNNSDFERRIEYPFTISANTTIYAKWIKASSDGITYSYRNKEYQLTGYVGTGGKVTAPNTFDGVAVTSIGAKAFQYTDITELIIPSSVTSIGDSAFATTLLTSITIPSGVELMGEYVFYNCANLENITFAQDSKLETIGKETFTRCEKLAAITIPNSVKVIGESAFYKCKSLATITFAPDSKLETIGARAFSSCVNLVSFNVPSAVTIIEPKVFDGCEKLNAVTFPQSSAWNTSYYVGDKLTEINVTKAAENALNLKNKDGIWFELFLIKSAGAN